MSGRVTFCDVAPDDSVASVERGEWALKQYPPVSFFVLLFSVVGVASCVDHRHHQIAFASAASSDELEFSVLPIASSTARVPARPTNDGRIVLVTIDGVRAEDVFDGADPQLRPGAHVEGFAKPENVMPRTHRLVETRGVALGADRPGCGVVRTASGANVSAIHHGQWLNWQV